MVEGECALGQRRAGPVEKEVLSVLIEDGERILPSCQASYVGLSWATRVTIQMFLDGVPEEAALLAWDGSVLAFNEGWRTLAGRRGYEQLLLGGDFFAFVRGRAAQGRKAAPPILDGLAGLLARRTHRFGYAYCDDGPRRDRHFRIDITRLELGGHEYLCATRSDITELLELRRRQRRLGIQLLRAHQDERRRIARELHGWTADMLRRLQSGLARLRLAQTEEAGAMLAECGETLQLLRNELQAFSFICHAPELDERSFVEAVEELARAFTAQAGLHLDLRIQRVRNVPEAAASTLYRFVQEALTNIYRHANAGAVRLVLKEAAGSLTMSVEDDGVGLDSGARSGVGLAGMEERLAFVAGRLSIETRRRGTRLTATVPLASAGASASRPIHASGPPPYAQAHGLRRPPVPMPAGGGEGIWPSREGPRAGSRMVDWPLLGLEAGTVRRLLQALPGQVALMGADGMVLAANRRWKRSVERNRIPQLRLFGNYFHFLGELVENGDTSAHHLLRGLSGILSGKQNRFVHNYVGEGRFEGHNVRVVLSGFTSRGHRFILASVHDITDLANLRRERRRLAGRILRAQEQERRRIARELHDSSAQLLLGLQLSLARMRATGVALGSEAIVVRCLEDLARVQREIRAFSFICHPPPLDGSRLEDAIQAMVRGFARRSGLGIDAMVSDVEGVSASVQSLIYRLAQEALLDIHLHTRARNVKLILIGAEQCLHLVVNDDSQDGPPLPSDRSVASGFGFARMKDRVADLGGQVAQHYLKHGRSLIASIPDRTLN